MSVLTVEGLDGLEMVVKAGSMTRADGTVPTPSNPAIIALNPVHFDKVPMPMPDGAAPPFAWTLQPAGAIFDPPVEITYPNMSGLPAGAIAYFLSFNHDTGKFEIIATGHVTDDGANIVSDPGVGIVKAGWGCNCPLYAAVGDCEGCTFTCKNPGTLQGGNVTVDNDLICEGETITFTASGVTHAGGELEKDCKDLGKTTIPITGTPIFEWQITSPALDSPLTGIGATAQVTNAKAGIYTCTFTAKVEDPPGAEVSYAPPVLLLAAKTATAVKVELKSLTFLSDHGLMRDNNIDFSASGIIFSEPEWVNGSNNYPISHTMDLNTIVKMEFEVLPSTLPSTIFKIKGIGTKGFNFDVDVNLLGGNNEKTLTSNDKLLKKNRKNIECNIMGSIIRHINLFKTK